MASRPSDPEMQARVQALQQELQRLGWTRGVNIQFDERWTTDDMELISDQRCKSGGAKPRCDRHCRWPRRSHFHPTDPLDTHHYSGVGDPVRLGWVKSLASPGGNVSGFTFYEPSVLGKMLEILKQLAPTTSRLALIYNPDNAASSYALRLTEEFSRSLGIEAVLAPFHGIADLEGTLDLLAKKGNGGIFSVPDLAVWQLRVQVAELAARYRLPGVYSDRIMVTSGGLISYDADRIDIFRRAASYVDRVLRGEKPGDLPVQQPNQLSAHDQLQNRQRARHRYSADPSCPRRQGDRVAGRIGRFRRVIRTSSRYRRTADSTCDGRGDDPDGRYHSFGGPGWIVTMLVLMHGGTGDEAC